MKKNKVWPWESASMTTLCVGEVFFAATDTLQARQVSLPQHKHCKTRQFLLPQPKHFKLGSFLCHNRNFTK